MKRVWVKSNAFNVNHIRCRNGHFSFSQKLAIWMGSKYIYKLGRRARRFHTCEKPGIRAKIVGRVFIFPQIAQGLEVRAGVEMKRIRYPLHLQLCSWVKRKTLKPKSKGFIPKKFTGIIEGLFEGLDCQPIIFDLWTRIVLWG